VGSTFSFAIATAHIIEPAAAEPAPAPEAV
jgi:hypothetical protein